jgi:CheY-like chemotaxis protein
MADRQSVKGGEEIRKQRFVLVVDGSARDSLTTGILLQNFGYTVTSVKSVDEALEFIAIALPALVVMELDLPGRRGEDLIAHIRRESSLASMPVIVQTIRPDVTIEEHCEGAGCTLYLRKPVSPETLYRAVQSTIEPTPRRHLRVSTYLRASVDEAGQGAELITMLSDEGMFIKTLNPRPIGSKHTVSFMVNRRIIEVEAVVLYSYSFGEGPNKDPGMGMKFSSLRLEDREYLREFIRRQVNPTIAPGR